MNYLKFKLPLQIEAFNRIFDFSWNNQTSIESVGGGTYHSWMFIGNLDYTEDRFFTIQIGKFMMVVGKI